MHRPPKNVTMREIAEQAGVSVSAVSLALNDKPGVTRELRERILELSQELGYDLGRLRDRQGVCEELGFLLNHDYLEQGDPGYAHMLSEAQKTAEEAGCHLLINAMSREEARAGKIPHFFSRNVQGVIVDDGFDLAYVRDCIASRAPVLLFGSDYLNADYDCVRADDFAGAFKAVTHLVDTGHKRIALLWCLPNHSACLRRRYAYSAALAQAELPEDPRLISPPAHDSTPECGYDGAMTLMDQTGGDIDGIFCVTDNLAMGCLRALWEMGHSIPDDVSVISFDNMSWCDHLMPPLTTMDVPRLRLARLAVTRLLEMVEARGRDEDETPKIISISPTLVERRSVANRRAELSHECGDK